MMGHIVCLGDSNTFGYDPRSYLGDQYPEDVRWTGLLKAAGWDVVNCGQNGLEIPTSERALTVFARLIEQAMPADVVTVMLGGNDLLQNPTFLAADVTERMERFLRYLLLSVPNRCFLLIAPPPMQPGAWVTEERLLMGSARLGGCYAALAERLGVAFADAGAWGIELAYDGVHFSPAGHAAFAEGLAAVLRGLRG